MTTRALFLLLRLWFSLSVLGLAGMFVAVVPPA